MRKTSSPRHGRSRNPIVQAVLLAAIGGALGGCAHGLATDWAQTQPACKPAVAPPSELPFQDGAPLPAASIAENT